MRRFALIAAGALLCLTGTTLFASPANAATVSPNDDSRCPASSFCLFQNTNYGGARHVWVGQGFDCSFASDGFNNIASSMINNTGSFVTLYDGACSGATYVAKPHSVDSTFTNNSFNDKASALNLP